MTLKERYRQFRQWQRQPIEYHESEERHTCNNCGRTFTDNYCPTCGQKASMGEVNWDSIRQGVLDLWGMGTRSLSYTLLQLLFRPGYLIGDYISGKRQVSFPPVKMLVLVALAVFLISKVGGLTLFDSMDSMTYTTDDKESPFFHLIEWLSKHYDWMALFLFMAMALPTYFIFRYSPRHPYHTLPQEFFIQVFNSTQFLCLGLIWNIILKVFGYEDKDMDSTMFFFFPLVVFYNYKQLFGYGFWGTLWRIICCYWLWIITLCGFMNMGNVISLLLNHAPWNQVMIEFRFFMISLTILVLSTYIFYIFNTWNKPLPQKGKKKTILGNVALILLATLSFLWFNCAIGSLDRNTNEFRISSVTVIFTILCALNCYYVYKLTKKRLSYGEESHKE